MPPATAERGFKRICMSCGTRFYDLNRRPIICPNCSTEFTGDIKVKTRRSRAVTSETEGQVQPVTASRKIAAGTGDEDDSLDDDSTKNDDIVSIEDLDEGDDSDDDIDIDDDIDVDIDEPLDDAIDDDIDVPIENDRD